MRARSTAVAVTSFVVAALAACTVDSPTAPSDLAPQMAHVPAGPNIGAKASGSELFTPGIETDGGPGATDASVSRADFTADVTFPATSTYLPELRAFSRNTTADNSDDITWAHAEGYQVFRSATAQTIDLNVSLHGIVVDGATDVSYVLADVYVYGGSAFEVQEGPICHDGRLGRHLFDGTYFCGSRLGWANLYIPVGDVTLPDVLTFDVAAGAEFGVYAILRAASSGGSADATETLTLDFMDDEFITALDFPTTPPDPGDLSWVEPLLFDVGGLTAAIFQAYLDDLIPLAVAKEIYTAVDDVYFPIYASTQKYDARPLVHDMFEDWLVLAQGHIDAGAIEATTGAGLIAMAEAILVNHLSGVHVR